MKKTLAIATAILAGLATPAFAQVQAVPVDMNASDAYTTITQPLTYTLAEDRVAAVTNMDDALSLLTMAEAHLRANDVQQAMPAIVAASAKVTIAHLLLFKDREFSRQIAPLSLRLEEAQRVVRNNPDQALALVTDTEPTLASLYQVQVASMGGGAGMGLEDLDNNQPVRE